jgi:hypothetical protein
MLTVTNSTLKAVCHHLKRFRVPELMYLSQKAVRDCLLNCPDLEELDLSGYWKISDATLADIAKTSTNIRKLNLSNCVQLTTEVCVH